MPSNRIKKRPAAAADLLKHFLAIVAVLIVAGCGGGGCGGGGCSSCGGVTPLANGFTPGKRIENAGSVRLTQSGLGFLQSNLGTLAKGLIGGNSAGGVLTFDIPATSGSTTGIDYSVCPGGPDPNANPPKCSAEIDIGSANLTITPRVPDASHPYNLEITGALPIRLRNLPLHVKGLCVFGFCAVDTDLTATLNGDGACPGGSYDQFPLDVQIGIMVDQNPNHTARFGYSQMKIVQVFDQTTANNNIKDHINICGGFLGTILDAVKGLFLNSLLGGLTGTLTSQIDTAMCQKESATTPCPAGTTADGNQICRYADNSCASTLLGTDGHIDLGGLLASVSPGTGGGLDFVFAAGGATKNPSGLAWGDLQAVDNGATLGMLGGAEASPLSKCVKMADIQLPTGIPIPDELYANSVAGWPAGTPGPHVGISVSERYANYALGSLYNSGLLCIGVSTETVPQLSSGTLGLVAQSSKDLGLQHESQQVALVIRPGAPPTVKFGNGADIDKDPLIRIGLKSFSIDFYMWSLDRFVRYMTATFDIDIPINLSVGTDGLTPHIGKLGVTNGKVTNNQLLAEDPAQISSALSSLLGGIVGQQLGSAIKPIDLSGALASSGLELIIPDTVDGQGSPGLRKLSKGSDNFLGIFAALGLAPTGPVPPPHPTQVAHTNAELTRKHVDRGGLSLRTIQRDNMPVVEVRAVSSLDDGTRAVEFAYKVDNGFWSEWTRSRDLTVRDDWMRMQGRHTIYVRSRQVGAIHSVDPQPAEVEVVIDTDPPVVKLALDGEGRMTVSADDTVSPDTLVRYRLDDRAWSEWTLASRLGAIDVSDAAGVLVEAQDAEGNVGSAHQELIRGRGESVAGAGCGCSTVGSTSTPTRGLWLLAAAVAGVFARMGARRRQAEKAAKNLLGGVAAVAVASSWAGCNCGGETHSTTTSGTTSSTSSGTGGGPACGDACTTLQPGLIGAYTSAVASGTDVWIAGYSEADWDGAVSYGDLVVGKWNGTSVDWKQVDGVPSDPPVDPTLYNTQGFRGGQTEPGDDVGLWTSIAVDATGNPAVAYFDRTHQALKFARYDGSKWDAHTVETKPNATIGRYAKMLFLGGKFVIAYQSIEPGGDGGAAVSKVRIATSAGATPAAGGWAFEDAAVSKTTPCRAQYCASGTTCVAATLRCLPTKTSCTPACASGQACVDSGSGVGCEDVLDKNKIDSYPDAIGNYVAVSPDGKGGFGIAYYDRTQGNLVLAAKNGGAWKTLQVDGAGADVGIGASLFIDQSGDWHLTYANGASEGLQYVKVQKGTTPGKPEIIDDGLGVGGSPFADGQHIVGDDSHVLVLSGGEVHVTYQDATVGTLRYAVGTPSATGHTWKVKAAGQSEFAGAFSSIVVVNNKLQLVNWWRVGGKRVNGDVRVLAAP